MMKTASGFRLESSDNLSGVSAWTTIFKYISAMDDLALRDLNRVKVAEYVVPAFQFFRGNELDHRLFLTFCQLRSFQTDRSTWKQ